MSHNNYMDEDEKDENEDLWKNYCYGAECNSNSRFKNRNEAKNSNIKDSFILLDEDF